MEKVNEIKRQKKKLCVNALKNGLRRVIRENPDSSKSEIKKLSGLSMEVVLNYIDYLTQNGLIYQSGKRGDGVGRKSEIYRINPDGGRFIGIKFTAHKVSGILMNFAGTTLYVYEKKYDRFKVSSTDLISSISDCVDDIIKNNSAKGICGIGVSSPGLVGLLWHCFRLSTQD